MGKSNHLVIVESPSKAKTIGKYLGPDYVVKASMGHLRDLPKSRMGVDLEHDFTPEYLPVGQRGSDQGTESRRQGRGYRLSGNGP